MSLQDYKDRIKDLERQAGIADDALDVLGEKINRYIDRILEYKDHIENLESTLEELQEIDNEDV